MLGVPFVMNTLVFGKVFESLGRWPGHNSTMTQNTMITNGIVNNNYKTAKIMNSRWREGAIDKHCQSPLPHTLAGCFASG